VPFSLGFQIYPWVERILRVRRNFIAAYGLALALTVLAIVVRWFVGEHVGARIPFITFYPAIIIATLVGGLWPGIFATMLSTLAAWYLFVPPEFSFGFDQRELIQLLLFVFISAIDVAIAALLNALVERLVIQQRNIRLLLESAPAGVVLVDDQGTIKLVNDATERLFGYDRTELTGKNVDVLVPEPRIETHRKERTLYQQKPEARLMGAGRDLSGRRKDGSEFPIEIGLNPLGRNGKPAVLATVIDISARKQVEDHQRLTIRELEHRTRNLFAVVQAIVSQSHKESKTVAEAEYVLGGRLRALSQAYELLADSAWEGVSLAQIFDRHLVVHSNRVAISGCDVIVVPRAAQQFALIVHELTTNALKYGALSIPGGRVSISGRIDRSDGDGLFVFLWKETGGPPVSPPTKRGFGSVILFESAHQFGRHVAVNYAPEGLTYEFHVDLKSIEMPKKAGAASRVVTPLRRPSSL
jgi:PAS domain S-box-containing protein